MNRRTFLKTGSLAILGASAQAAESVASAFDAEMNAFMSARKVPGGSLAIARGGRLLYAKGYGLADRDTNEPVSADSLFRIASISKPITAVAVVQYAQAGKLDLDASIFELLGIDFGKASDARLRQVTVRHLLHHTGGWDRGKSFDPMFRALEIARKTGSPAPAAPDAVIRYMLDVPLDADPGAAFAYSNFGYCLLGRLLERLSGTPYEACVKERVLAPAGARAMRLGATPRAKRVHGEVCYYTAKNEEARDVFSPDESARVPWPYGGFHLEAMDAHGGWLASTVDLVRFASALDDAEKSPLLPSAGFATLFEPPAAPVSRQEDGALKDHYCGCGWYVRPVGKSGRANHWHSGSLPGTSTLLVRRHDGLNWAVCFNQRSDDKKLPDGAIDAALHRAAAKVADWPEGTPL